MSVPRLAPEAAPGAVERDVGFAGPVLLLLAVLAGAAFFADGLAVLFEAWRLPEYSHGPLIPFLSGFLFLRHLRSVPPRADPAPDRRPGLAALAAAFALGALGKATGIGEMSAYGLVTWIGGLVLVCFGWRVGRGFWPSVLHLCFMLPLPGLLYFKATTGLQLASSQIGVALLHAVGAPAALDGNIIELGGFRLHVAEACSGLRYMFPIMSFSYMFAALYRGPATHKAALLMSAAPLAVLMNAARVAAIGIAVDRVGLDHAAGLSHLIEGWVVFLACVALLFGLVRLLRAIEGLPSGLSEALDLDLSGCAPQLGRLRQAPACLALAAAAGIFALGAVSWRAAPERQEAAIVREPLSLFPLRLGERRGGPPVAIPADLRAALGADDLRLIPFELEGEPPVELFVAWYADQRKGGIHSPEICLPGGGWEIAALSRIDLPSSPGAASFRATRAVIQKDLDRALVYFWFEQYGGRLGWDYAAKAALAWSGLVHGRTDGALIRLVTPIGPTETEAEADARLQTMLRPLLAELSRFVPAAGAADAASLSSGPGFGS